MRVLRQVFGLFSGLSCLFFMWAGQASVASSQPAVISLCTGFDEARRSFAEVRHDEPVAAVLAFGAELGNTARGIGPRCGAEDAEGFVPITVRQRGFSSVKFAKKQYSFTFRDAEGGDKAVAPLGLPASPDWALHGPYIDASYLRNALAYTIGQQLGTFGRQAWFAPAGRFVELFVNNDYQGVFLLSEKIEPHKGQLDLPKARLEDLKSLHFILEVSLRSPDFKTRYGTSLEYSYPGRRKLRKWEARDPEATAALRKHILSEVEGFEARLLASDFADAQAGYRPLVDIASFVDYFIAQEVFKNIDGFRRSAFFYKGRDGLLHMGPLWDFDLALGNLNFWGMAYPQDWVHEDRGLPPKPLFWFTRLLRDPYFNALVRQRYQQLRAPGGPLTDAVIGGHLQGLTAELGVYAPWRDAQRWRGTYTRKELEMFHQLGRGYSHAQQVGMLRQWLRQRLYWLDRNMPALAWKAQS